MSDIISQMNAVRIQNGQTPLPNPHVIQGFGPEVSMSGGDYVPDTVQDPPTFPPEPTGYFPPEPEPQPIQADQPRKPLPPEDLPDLVIWGSKATCKGRDVTLSKSDERLISGIVLRAIAKEIKAQLADVIQRKPRAKAMVAKDPVVAPIKRKRGRPRKVVDVTSGGA